MKHTCKNCRFIFKGKFCPECGQSIKDFDRPLRYIMLDFTGNLFAFDTRIWRTINNVVFRPGLMEQEFADGKRVKYMPPFRLYVFVSFIFFLMISWMSEKNIHKGKINVEIAGKEQSHYDHQYIQPNDLLAENQDSLINDTLRNNYLSSNLNAQNDTLGKYFADVDFENIKKNPEIYSQRLIKYFSWSLFLLMPLYGGFLWLVFRRSRPFYVTHLNLAINHHVFIFLVFILILLVQIVLPNKALQPENYLMLLIPLYIVAGAHKLFPGRWRSLIWRLMIIQFFYLCIVLAAAVGLVIYTFS